MDSGRFETFIDAILAIMMTVMVLKIPQPETMTFSGIWDLHILYIAYIISFIIIFSVWDHHRKLFNLVEEINNAVIGIYGVLIFFITLLPYFTAWVAHYPFELVPEIIYGIIFFMVNIIYVLCTEMAITQDVHNIDVNGISFNNLLILNISLFVIGTVIAFLGYPLAVLIMCLLTVITWNTIPYIQKTYVIGDD